MMKCTKVFKHVVTSHVQSVNVWVVVAEEPALALLKHRVRVAKEFQAPVSQLDSYSHDLFQVFEDLFALVVEPNI